MNEGTDSTERTTRGTADGLSTSDPAAFQWMAFERGDCLHKIKESAVDERGRLLSELLSVVGEPSNVQIEGLRAFAQSRLSAGLDA